MKQTSILGFKYNKRKKKEEEIVNFELHPGSIWQEKQSLSIDYKYLIDK